MVGITISEIFEYVEKFERMLAELYTDVSHESQKDAVSLLGEYIARNRSRTMEAIEELPTKEIDHIRSVRLQYPPHIPGPHCLEEIPIDADSTAQQILDAAMQFDECLVHMYEQIADQTVEHETKELFENLIQLERNDELRLKKIKASLV
ncbi:MAG: ferritin family protein [Planctomycetota bacterium]|jgi:rubrerythrin